MKISEFSTNLWTVLTVMEICILDHERLFRTYVREGLESVIDFYVGEALYHDHTDLLKLLKAMYETEEEVISGCLVVGRIKHDRCIGAHVCD